MQWLETRIPPPVVALVIALLMWLGARALGAEGFEWAGRGYVGAPIMVLGVAIAVGGVVTFRRVGTTVDPRHPERAQLLVTSGIFAWTRNPMYLGVTVALLGWAVVLGPTLLMLGAALFVSYIQRFQIGPEERVMRDKFGAEFVAYCRRTRRWI